MTTQTDKCLTKAEIKAAHAEALRTAAKSIYKSVLIPVEPSPEKPSETTKNRKKKST